MSTWTCGTCEYEQPAAQACARCGAPAPPDEDGFDLDVIELAVRPPGYDAPADTMSLGEVEDPDEITHQRLPLQSVGTNPNLGAVTEGDVAWPEAAPPSADDLPAPRHAGATAQVTGSRPTLIVDQRPSLAQRVPARALLLAGGAAVVITGLYVGYCALAVAGAKDAFSAALPSLHARLDAVVGMVGRDDVAAALEALGEEHDVRVVPSKLRLELRPVVFRKGGASCEVAAMPVAAEQLSPEDAAAFEDRAAACEIPPWIVHIRGEIEIPRGILRRRADLEHVTWVVSADPD